MGLVGIIFWVLIGATVGGMLGEWRRVEGAMLFGAVLGPIGWMIILCMDGRPQCPECLGRVEPAAHRCRHCGVPLPASAPPDPLPAPEPVPPPAPKLPPGTVMVPCPACAGDCLVAREDLCTGVVCAHCGRGFVPQPAR